MSSFLPCFDSLPQTPRQASLARARAGAILATIAALCACAGYQPGPRAVLGAASGAAAGGLIASAASDRAGDAIAAGVLLGGLLGGAIGDSLDRADRSYANYDARPPRRSEPVSYEPDANWDAAPAYEDELGPCREYSQLVTIRGRTRRVVGTACREPDGSWRVVD